MKYCLLFFLLISLHAEDTFKQRVMQTHIRSLNTTLFFASEEIISSGHFRFKTSHATLDNYFFPFSFPFKSSDACYDYYLNGSIGYSKYIQKNMYLFKNSDDKYHLHNYALKIGGGVKYQFSTFSDLKLGASYIHSYLYGKYQTKKTIDISSSDSKMIHTLLNDNKHYHTFEISSAISYHPTYKDYHPYATASIRHFSTHLNKTILSKSVLESTITQLKLGLTTPAISELFGLSLTLEPYVSVLHAFGDIDNTLNLHTVYVLGNTFRLNAYPVTCWVEDLTSFQRDSMHLIRDITLDVNIAKGYYFKGFNIGLGVKF